MAAEFFGLEVGTWADLSSNLMALAALAISWRAHRKTRTRVWLQESGKDLELRLHNLSAHAVSVIEAGFITAKGECFHFDTEGCRESTKLPIRIEAYSTQPIRIDPLANTLGLIKKSPGWYVRLSESSWKNPSGRTVTTLPPGQRARLRLASWLARAKRRMRGKRS